MLRIVEWRPISCTSYKMPRPKGTTVQEHLNSRFNCLTGTCEQLTESFLCGLRRVTSNPDKRAHDSHEGESCYNFYKDLSPSLKRWEPTPMPKLEQTMRTQVCHWAIGTWNNVAAQLLLRLRVGIWKYTVAASTNMNLSWWENKMYQIRLIKYLHINWSLVEQTAKCFKWHTHCHLSQNIRCP